LYLLIAKLVALFCCLLYLRKSSQPMFAAIIYGFLSLLITMIVLLTENHQLSGNDWLGLAVGFFFDVGVAGAGFWLIDRYQSRLEVFFPALVLGVAINLVGHFWIFQAVSGAVSGPQPSAPRAAAHLTFPPHLWSHHKTLSMSADTCAERALSAFNAFAFTSVAQNGTYLYGNSGANRVVMKCVERGKDKSFVYIAVAGPDKSVVEDLRNSLARSL